MRLYFLTACLAMLLAQSCAKPKDPIAPKRIHAAAYLRETEDQDRRIRIRTTDTSKRAMSAALVTISSGGISLSALTDTAGHTELYPGAVLNWHLHVTKSGFLSLDTNIVAADTLTELDLTLFAE